MVNFNFLGEDVVVVPSSQALVLHHLPRVPATLCIVSRGCCRDVELCSVNIATLTGAFVSLHNSLGADHLY